MDYSIASSKYGSTCGLHYADLSRPFEDSGSGTSYSDEESVEHDFSHHPPALFITSSQNHYEFWDLHPR